MNVGLEPVAKTGLGTRLPLVVGACACAAVSAFLYAVDPVRHAVYPQCFLYQTTGLYCAGCGSTRALHALLHGRVVEALHDNVFFVLMLPVLFGLAGSYARRAWITKEWPTLQVETRRLLPYGVAFWVIMFGFMVLRNLSGWPFELLRPL